MTPDTPLLFFWTCCLWATARLMRSGNALWWLAVGLFAGLALASKYTAVLLWFGVGAWLLATPAMWFWLRRPAPWLGASIGAAVFLPVLVWNADHGWASFVRQGSRTVAWQPANAVRFLGELIAGQFGLVTPLIFVLCIAGIVAAARRAWQAREPAWTLLAALTLPAVLLFLQHSLGDRVQGNWPAIVYPAAAIAAGGLQAPFWQRLHMPAVVLGLVITLLAYQQASLALLPLPAGIDPIALRLAGWDTLAAEVDAVRRASGGRFVAADQYGTAAELARSLPSDVTVVGAEPVWALFSLPAAAIAGQTGILVRSVREGAVVAQAPWAGLVEVDRAERKTGAAAVEAFRLYRIVGADPTAATVVLPRPGR